MFSAAFNFPNGTLVSLSFHRRAVDGSDDTSLNALLNSFISASTGI